MGKFVAKKYVVKVTSDRHDEMHRQHTDHEHVDQIGERWRHVREPIMTNAIAGPQTAMTRGVR